MYKEKPIYASDVVTVNISPVAQVFVAAGTAVLVVYLVDRFVWYVGTSNRINAMHKLGYSVVQNLGRYSWSLGFGRLDLEHARRFGKCHVTEVGSTVVLVTADAQMVREICTNEYSAFSSRSHVVRMTGWWERAMRLATTVHWRVLKPVVRPTLSVEEVKDTSRSLSRCMEHSLTHLETRVMVRNVRTLNMRKIFSDLTLDIFASIAFNLEANCLNNPHDQFKKLATECVHLKPAAPAIFSYMFSFMKPIIDGIHTFLTGIDAIDNGPSLRQIHDAEQTVQERQRRKYNDLLDLVLKSQRSNEVEFSLADVEQLANGMSRLLAGYETIQTTLSWCTFCLATNPKCQALLIEEIDKEIGGKPPSFENVLKLKYLHGFVSETLRLYPPVCRTSHELLNSVVICGRLLPKSSRTMAIGEIHMAIYAMHRLEEYWPKPEIFDPERFLPKNKDNITPYSYLPFGIDQWNCGNNFVLFILKLTIVTLLQRYRYDTMDPAQMTLKLDRHGRQLQTDDAMWLRLRRR